MIWLSTFCIIFTIWMNKHFSSNLQLGKALQGETRWWSAHSSPFLQAGQHWQCSRSVSGFCASISSLVSMRQICWVSVVPEQPAAWWPVPLLSSLTFFLCYLLLSLPPNGELILEVLFCPGPFLSAVLEKFEFWEQLKCLFLWDCRIVSCFCDSWASDKAFEIRLLGACLGGGSEALASVAQ